MRKLIKRATAETPAFFKKLRNISMVIAGAATALLASPVVLPVAITTAAGYLVTASAVATVISQLTVKNEEPVKVKKNPGKGGKNGNHITP